MIYLILKYWNCDNPLQATQETCHFWSM